MDPLQGYLAWLDAKIDLDEEAHDPDGLLPGLYAARELATAGLRQPPSQSGSVNLTVWAYRQPEPALSGSYVGSGALAEGAAAVILTVVDLWMAGESNIQIEIHRTNEGEDSEQDR